MDRAEAAAVLERARRRMVDALTVAHLRVELAHKHSHHNGDEVRCQEKRRSEIEEEITALDIALDALLGKKVKP